MAKDNKSDFTYYTQFPSEAVSFDADAFDHAIRTQGVTLVHYRALRCPVGMIDQYDSRRPHEDHENCSNGFLYIKAGEITALFVDNGNQPKLAEVGVMDGSTSQVTFPRCYDNTDTPVFVAPFDRFYLKEDECDVISWQIFAYNPSMWNKLQFPIKDIETLIDANGKEYTKNKDFEIVKGQIHWIGAVPGINLQNNKGVICSVRYSYVPFWYCRNLLNEIRVTQHEDPMGNRKVQRMQYSAVLQREYVFEMEQRDDRSIDPASARQVKGPGSGSFGER